MTTPITEEELARLEAEIFPATKFTSTEALDRLCAALPSLIAAVREARRERDVALSRAAVLCDRQALGRPENRHKDDPRAAYQAGAAKCAWEIRQLARGATNAIHAIADDRNAHARGRADERTDVVRWCRTTLSQNRNAQAFADDIERGAHVTGKEDDDG